MASLAIALAGAGIGSATAIGASTGWLVGSIIGQLLFPTKGPDVVQEGPRLGDLSVTSSAYGASIPLTYGTIRHAGNMIWSTGLQEVKTTTSQQSGGKGGILGGGGSSTSVTYTYFATFALAFAEGVADDVLRIWADGKLIFDKTGEGDDISKAGLKFRFYSGSETQVPDSLIEADKGANATPAFRGLCYIVFDTLALQDFGNRIPSITAEITFNESTDKPVQSLDYFTIAEGGLSEATQNYREDAVRPDFSRGVIYFANFSGVAEESVLRRADTRSFAENRQVLYTLDALGNDVTHLDLMTVLENGEIIAATSVSNRNAISVINPDSLAITGTFGVAGGAFGNSKDGFEVTVQPLSVPLVVEGLVTSEHYVMTASIFSSLGLLKANGSLTYVWDSDTAPNQPVPSLDTAGTIVATCPGAKGIGFAEAYVCATGGFVVPTGDDIEFYRMVVNAGANYDSVLDIWSGVTFTHIFTLNAGDLIPGEAGLGTFVGLLYDAADDSILLQTSTEDSTKGYMIKINSDTGAVIWRTEIPTVRSRLSGFQESNIEEGIYGQMDLFVGWALRTATGELFYEESGWGASHNSGAGWWDSKTNSFIGGFSPAFDDLLKKFLFFRGAGQGVALDTIVSDLALRSGLVAADIDVTNLATKTVPGYTIGRRTTIKGSIQSLAGVYFFDGVESDWQLKFLLREGKTVQASVVQSDLAPLSGEAGEFFQEDRIQDVELPLRFTLLYMDKDNDYLQSTHSAKRVLGPLSSMNSRNEMSLEIAAALSVSFAKQAAEKALFSAWIERSSFSLQLGWKFLKLDPSDIITISHDDGTLFRVRLISTDVGVGYSIDCKAISEDSVQYTSDVNSDAGSSGLTNQFLSQLLTKLILLQTPLLRDFDDVGRSFSSMYYAMGGYGQTGWTAANLFKSNDNVAFDLAGAIINEMKWGAAANALGDTELPFQTDESNQLTVFMTVGASALVTVTQTQMLNGSNPAALVHSNGDVEVFQFRTVSTNTDGSRTLSGLLRGRRGTEVFTVNHAIGDLFVLLETDTVDKIPLPTGDKNLIRYFKGVTSGQVFEEAPLTTASTPLNDLKPYAVVNHVASIESNNDIHLTWVRRTRVGGALIDGQGAVPLSEDSENYDVDFFVSAGAPTAVRIVSTVASAGTVYTSAQQVADGLATPISTLTVKVFQNSAQVGRGFSKKLTLDVV